MNAVTEARVVPGAPVVCPQCACVVEPSPCPLAILRTVGRCMSCASSDKRSRAAFDRMPRETRDAWQTVPERIVSSSLMRAGAMHDAELGRLAALMYRTTRPDVKARRVAACVAHAARMERAWLVAGRLMLAASGMGEGEGAGR